MRASTFKAILIVYHVNDHSVFLGILGSACKDLTDTPVTGRGGQEDTGGEEERTENDTPKEPTGETSAPTGFTVLGGFENKPIQKV